MTDDTLTPIPVTPPPAPAPSPAPPVDPDVQKYAAIFARHPETFEGVLAELEHSGHVQVRAEVNNLKRELTIRDAIADHGLTRADADFIRGNTPAEINASAAALKARIGSAAAPPPPDGTPAPTAPSPTPTPAPTQPQPLEPPPLPEHRGGRTSVEQAETELIEASANWCKNFDITNLGRTT